MVMGVHGGVMTELLFRDRVAAGRALGRRLTRLRDADAVVLGLPRGGVPVAFEVAAALRLPLDVIIVRKIGVPSDPELAMGAVGEDNTTIVNTGVVTAYRVSDADLTGRSTSGQPRPTCQWACSEPAPAPQRRYRRQPIPSCGSQR